jgi:hypothetical protein
MFVIILRQQTREDSNLRWSILGVLGGLSVSAIGTVLLYLQQGLVRIDLSPQDTIFPVFLWFGYYLTVMSFSYYSLEYFRKSANLKIAVLVILLTAFVISGAGMVDYSVFWNDGAVLVVFNSPFSEYLGILAGMVVGISSLYLSIVLRFQYIDVGNLKQGSKIDRMSADVLKASLAFSIQFIVPRAMEGSVTNPASVKILAFAVIAAFILFLTRSHQHWIDTTPIFHDLQTIEKHDPISDDDVMIVACAVAATAVYVILSRLGIPVLSVQEKIDMDILIIYLGEWFEYHVFLDLVGAVLPIALACISFVFIYNQRCWRIQTELYLAGRLVSTFIVALVLTLSTSPSSGMMSVMTFMFAPLVAWVLFSWIVKIRGGNEANHMDNTQTITCKAIAVYAVSVFSAFMADIITAQSPFGILHLGGAGPVDGLLWAPILSMALFSVYLVARKSLKL